MAGSLSQTGIIRFDSVDDFLSEYQVNLRLGGFWVETSSSWPLRQKQVFSLEVGELNLSINVLAEVVFAGNGKVGLQVEASAEARQSISELVTYARLVQERKAQGSSVDAPAQLTKNLKPISPLEAARTPAQENLETQSPSQDQSHASPMQPNDSEEKKLEIALRAVLDAKGVIRFPSPATFLAETREVLSQAGLWVSSDTEWPLRQMRTFVLLVASIDESVEVDAEVVFAGQGNVGLQLDIKPKTQQALKTLMAKARQAMSNPKDTETLPTPDPATTPVSGPMQWTGFIASGRTSEEFQSAEPVPLDACCQSDTSLFRLVASITQTRKPLLLTLIHSQKEFHFLFNDAGRLVRFVSADSDRDLVERLQQGRQITRSVAQEILEQISPERPAEVTLLERQVVKSHLVWNAIRDQVIDSFENARSLKKLPFRIEIRETQRRTGIGFGALMIPWLDRAIRELSAKEMERLLDPLWKSFPIPHPQALWPVGALTIDKQGSRFVQDYLDGTRSLQEALDVFPFGAREGIKRLVLILRMLGTMIFLRERRASQNSQITIANLSRELLELESKNRFEQLEVHWTAHPSEFESAMKRIRDKYSSDGAIAKISMEAVRLCQRRISLAKEALEYLRDSDKRRSYRENITSSQNRRTSADLLAGQAETALLKQNWSDARKLYEVAFELNAKPEYQKKLESIPPD